MRVAVEWVFQYNPRRFDQLRAQARSASDWWSMKQNRDMVSVGDRVFFWRSGTDAALTAVGHVISPVYERESQFGTFAVDVRFDQNVETRTDTR
jgi:EVE domain